MLSSSEALCQPSFVAHSHPISDAFSDSIVKDEGDDGKRVKVTLEFLISCHPGMFLSILTARAGNIQSSYFFLTCNNRLAHKFPLSELAYRFHPDVLNGTLCLKFYIRVACIRFPSQLLRSSSINRWNAFGGMAGSKKTPLVELEEIFRSLLGYSLTLPFVIADIGGFVTFRAGDFTWRIFHAHNVDGFPDNLRNRVISDRENRLLGFSLLRSLLDQHQNGVISDPIATTAKVHADSKAEPTITPKTSATRRAMKRHENISKISSFFSVIKKNSSTEKADFFPPFQLRPDSLIASINPLTESDVIEKRSTTSHISRSFKHVVGGRRPKKCVCYGIDGSLRVETWKLLQFWEDYRPAYYGTLMPRKNSVFNSRRPFAKDTGLIDYENDSEAEWAEGALECADDGESITGSDEEDEDEEDELTCDSEDDGWLVPDGYLSEGEGVDEPSSSSSLPAHLHPDFDPGLHQEGTIKQKEKPAKRKLVVLKTKIHGPWISNGPSWSLFDSSLNNELSFPFDPFLGADQMVAPSKTEFSLSKDMIDYIKDDLLKPTPLEELMEKLALRFGKLPKKNLERRLQELLSPSIT